MANENYKIAFHRELKNFISVFSDDSDDFFKKDGHKPFHPAEFGRFREDATKRILKMILKPEVSISDGFLINSNDEISTQCDI
jgi:hypothetical protein